MAPSGETSRAHGDGPSRPVPAHSDDVAAAKRRAAAERARKLRAERARRHGQPVRAINEDDDGYDPYSDFHDKGPAGPLFERDPWN